MAVQWFWASRRPAPSVLLVPSLPPGVDELPKEQLAAQGTPGVLGVAATAGETVGVHHAAVGQWVYLHQEAEGPAGLMLQDTELHTSCKNSKGLTREDVWGPAPRMGRGWRYLPL